MLVLVFTRSYIPIQKTDLSSLNKYRHPVFPGLAVEEEGRVSKSYQWVYDRDATNELEHGYMAYMSYHPHTPNHPPLDNYDVREDWRGPLFFLPD